MQRVVIVGGSRGGLSIIKILHELDIAIQGIIEEDPHAPACHYGKKFGIPIYSDLKKMNEKADIIIDMREKKDRGDSLGEVTQHKATIIPQSIVYVLLKLFYEKERLTEKLHHEMEKHKLIFNSFDDGIIVVNSEGKIILMNKSAGEMVQTDHELAIGKHVLDVIPNSGLPQVLKQLKGETNKELTLKNGLKIVTSRMPIIDGNGNVIGAFAIFKNITEVVKLAEEITNLKEVQTMLEAVIQSSEEAISVVDETGKGIIINPAYTRLTGLTEEQVIGKPASIDISEGKSMHMHVLKTKKPVRGVTMKVGPNKKEVVVNVAPVIVNGKLKGSVGVIHDISEIKKLNRELSKARQIIRRIEAKYTFEDIIGDSAEMRLAIEQAKMGANTPATVLIRGESGTGKELFAHAIHNESDRKYNKFIRVNCAALSEPLLESELFGYEDGAFTGAKKGGKKGLFEEAHNGSIFLDEIGELSANTQAKLLRVLQENEITRVGGTKTIPINVRIIAATNVNLEEAIKKGMFREDLYYRLNRMPIHIPPLRRRKEDIPLLCQRLIGKINQDYGRNVKGITEKALALFYQYHWPGNVRELENILGRAIIFMNKHEIMIDTSHLPFLGQEKHRSDDDFHHDKDLKEGMTLQTLLDEYERKIIIHTLHKTNGNKTETAKMLGLSVRNLYYKLKKHKIEKSSMQFFSKQ